jgi:TusA-related sulfurtransferase
MKIIKAIQKINPNAIVTVSGNDIDTCEIIWQENTTPISKKDIKAMLQSVEQDLIEKETKKASGKQKLKDLGLDDDEIQALIGV